LTIPEASSIAKIHSGSSSLEQGKELIGAVILCGGQSSRMGFDKFRLPFGERTFLQCVVEKLQDSVGGPIVAAASRSTHEQVQKIAQLIASPRLKVVVDNNRESGPVEGIRCGLAALEGQADWGFVTGCDVPLLRSQTIDLLVDVARDSTFQAVLPHRGARIYGITAEPISAQQSRP